MTCLHLTLCWLILITGCKFPFNDVFSYSGSDILASLLAWMTILILKHMGFAGPGEWGIKLIHMLERRQDSQLFRFAVFAMSLLVYPAE